LAKQTAPLANVSAGTAALISDTAVGIEVDDFQIKIQFQQAGTGGYDRL